MFRAVRSNHDQILQVIASISRSIQIFRYHMQTARDVMQGIVDEAEPQGSENFMLLFGDAQPN
jgi:hypothetical protein